MKTELMRVFIFVIESFLHVWPLLVATLPLAIIIRQMDISSRLNELLTKNIYISIVIATLIGAVSPFCSCSVIPIISALLIANVPLAPIMSFWIASPSMDPEIFFLSIASIGMPLAISRVIATLIMSLSAGFITQFLISNGLIKNNSILKIKPFADHNSLISAASNQSNRLQNNKECDCSETQPSMICCTLHSDNFKIIDTSVAIEHASLDYRRLGKDSLEAILLVTKFLIIAYILEAIIKFYLPPEVIKLLVGGSPMISILKATLVSIPLYTTNLSALGIVSGLMDHGMSSGAALSFLIGGATTTIPAMSAVYSLVKKPIFMLYLSFAIAGSLISGIVFALLGI